MNPANEQKIKIKEALDEIESDIREKKENSEFCSFLKNYNSQFCLDENFYESEDKYIATLPVDLKDEDVRFDDTPPVIPQIRKQLEQKASKNDKINNEKNKTINRIGFSRCQKEVYQIDYLGPVNNKDAYRVYLELWYSNST